jgi:3-oxoacyl-(acyl-carrier-protein) synthase
MRRVVVTGFGIVSCLGNVADTVSRALRDLRSGIRAMPDYAARGLRSQVAGVPHIDLEAAIDRKLRRFMAMRRPTPTWRCARRSPTPACRRSRSATRAPA